MNNAAVEERHTKLQAERINQATWPGRDLWEVAELQLKLDAAERRIEELEKRENAKVYCMKCGENVAYLGD